MALVSEIMLVASGWNLGRKHALDPIQGGLTSALPKDFLLSGQSLPSTHPPPVSLLY